MASRHQWGAPLRVEPAHEQAAGNGAWPKIDGRRAGTDAPPV